MKTDCAHCAHYDRGFCHLINARLGTQDGSPFPTINGLGDEHCDTQIRDSRITVGGPFSQRHEDGGVAKEEG